MIIRNQFCSLFFAPFLLFSKFCLSILVSHLLPFLYILPRFPWYRELSHSQEKIKTSWEKMGLGWVANKLVLWHVGCAGSGHQSPPSLLGVTGSPRPSIQMQGMSSCDSTVCGHRVRESWCCIALIWERKTECSPSRELPHTRQALLLPRQPHQLLLLLVTATAPKPPLWSGCCMTSYTAQPQWLHGLPLLWWNVCSSQQNYNWKFEGTKEWNCTTVQTTGTKPEAMPQTQVKLNVSRVLVGCWWGCSGVFEFVQWEEINGRRNLDEVNLISQLPLLALF